MAALQKIRSKAGLLIGILAVALMAFIFPWNELTSFINKQRDKAFVVDGEVVSTGTYLKRVDDFETFQKMISGRGSLDENTSAQVKEFVYQQMVKEMMLDKQASELGLTVSDEEVKDMTVGQNISPILRQIPLFADQQTGQFSLQSLNQFLSFISTDVKSIPLQQADQRAQLIQLQSIWNTIQNMIKYERLEDKYNTLLASAIIPNNLEAMADNNSNKSTADIAYVVNRYNSIPDSAVTVTDKEIDALYGLRKNNFKNQDELRKITFFSKEVTPSDSDFANIEKEINTAKEKLAVSPNPALVVADYSEIPFQDIFYAESNLSPEEISFVKTAATGDIYGPVRDGEAFRLYKLIDRTIAPDSVKLRLIVLPGGADLTTANNKADSIINVIKAGKDFAIVANEISPQANGGEIGWMTEPMLASAGKELIDATFNGTTGSITKLNMQGQVQIIKIEAKSRPVNKYKLALIQMSVPVSDQTLASLDNELNQFVAENSNNKNFAEAARNKGYNLSENVLISGSNPNLNQISGSRQVVNWAFNEPVGTVKKFDLSDYKIIAKVESEIAPGYLPVSEVKESLQAELIKDKKAEKMITELKAKNLTSLSDYATALNTKIDTIKFVTFNTMNLVGLGQEYIINAYAELGEVNKLQAPVKGQNGVYALTVLNKVNQDNESNNEVYKKTVKGQTSYRVLSQLSEALKSKMNVKDNRVKFF